MGGKSIILIIIIVLLLAAGGLFLIMNRADAPAEADVNFELLPVKSNREAYVAPSNNEPEAKPAAKPIIPGGVAKPDAEAKPGYISQDDEINILVDEPLPGATVSSPFTVSGEARVFEGTVLIQVTNINGEVLIDELATAHAPDVGKFGSFKITLSFQFSSTKDGFVEVFSESARDGSRENLVKIPVKFE